MTNIRFMLLVLQGMRAIAACVAHLVYNVPGTSDIQEMNKRINMMSISDFIDSALKFESQYKEPEESSS